MLLPAFNGFCNEFTFAPALQIEQNGIELTISWTPVENATSYTLLYVPYPNVEYIGLLDLGGQTKISFDLWDGAAFYVAVQAGNNEGVSEYSNVEHFSYHDDTISDGTPDSGPDGGPSDHGPAVKFVVTDSMQTKCFDNEGNIIDAPKPGELYYGQDAQYEGIIPSYTDNGDGTVTDNNTGLMWQQTPPSDKMDYDDARTYVENLQLGGYTDWRLPTIKESFSIAMFDGKLNAEDTSLAVPYINTEYFDFTYDKAKPYTGSYWTSTVCKMPANNDYELMEKNYGFNWADGHLKSYADGYNIDGSSTGASIPAGARAVRGEENVYGVNDFNDNKDGTITDNATGLMWTKQDSGYVNDDGTIRAESDENFGYGRTWTTTLAWVEAMNAANYLGYSDWHLPDIKELQSIVQYEKTELPATDPDYFNLSRPDCYVWSSTTCGDFPEMANYIAFGRGYGIDLVAGNESVGPPDGEMGPSPLEDDVFSSERPTGPPPEMHSSDTDEEDVSVSATVDDFVDVHGPGCMRADYKDTEAYVSQVPELSRTFWEKLYGVEYLYTFDVSDTTTEFDLSSSENAADYIVIYNYAFLVRSAE